MQLARLWKKIAIGSLAPVMIAAASSVSLATGRDCCQPSPQVFQSEFFGHYATCWRPWPGGQPQCPHAPPPAKARSAAKKGTEDLELLPMPKREEGT